MKQYVRQMLLYVALPVAAAVLLWYILSPQPLYVCSTSADSGSIVCRPSCKKGQFSLPGMSRCRPWLSCNEISASVKVTGDLGKGLVKKVYLAKWRDYQVAYSGLRSAEFRADFRHGLNMLIGLQPSPRVTQLLGHCKQTFITEYHPLGSADNFHSLIASDKFSYLDTASFRFGMCVKYVEVLELLHHSPIGTRVMCDSNTLEKTLSQFLLTNNFDIIANDLDALPQVTSEVKVKCGPREIEGSFVAPEQLWPFPDLPFDDTKMPAYDEKTDIWKVPAVCLYFLGDSPESQSLRFHLFRIHKRCKNSDPKLRPNASEILEEYREIKQTVLEA